MLSLGSMAGPSLLSPLTNMSGLGNGWNSQPSGGLPTVATQPSMGGDQNNIIQLLLGLSGGMGNGISQGGGNNSGLGALFGMLAHLGLLSGGNSGGGGISPFGGSISGGMYSL